MCGIAGLIDPKISNKEKVIGDMVSAIVHRGPDNDGFYVDGNVGLGMRRLSIIDLATGEQPITSKDGTLLIFFNGEIYNFKELREDLVVRGYAFKTHSDTEVILHMYEEYGEKMLTKLRGMFTFCIYHTIDKKIFIARDFFGIKPLYYLLQGEKIVGFSSEIKSFLQFPGFKKEINDNAVYNYLSFQYNPLIETFFKNVFKLPPGHFLSIDLNNNRTEIKKYWSFDFSPEERLSEDKTREKIYETMKDSVEHHMIADVPVGAFLSGGIDSSIITTLMQKIRGERKIKTFTVGFSTLTEGNEAKETSNFLGTDHTEIKIGPEEYFKVLPKAVYHFDEPVADPSAIGLYFVAREARKHVKVVLSGEGADELFGGYNIYLAPIAREKMIWLPKSFISLFINLPFSFFGKNYLKRVSMRLEDWYIGNASIFNKKEVDLLWKDRRKNEVKTLSLDSLYKQASALNDSEKMQYIDINTWLVGDILAKADKMTMANSLELRVPFLDIEVAKLARTLPAKFKWKNGVTKYLLREAFQKIIPENTRNRKKLGFPTPIRDWFTKDRTDVYDTILDNEYINTHLNTKNIRNLIDEHIAKKVDNSRKIYLLLMLAIWYDVFIKQKV
ncbi:asparagine synthase (glutamine-hydrolyzing) [Patescibacteria group bacterium]|nr:asparagine synthase (glutamine-hydrolyzing) [Patescibacteria group bacterium]